MESYFWRRYLDYARPVPFSVRYLQTPRQYPQTNFRPLPQHRPYYSGSPYRILYVNGKRVKVYSTVLNHENVDSPGQKATVLRTRKKRKAPSLILLAPRRCRSQHDLSTWRESDNESPRQRCASFSERYLAMQCKPRDRRRCYSYQDLSSSARYSSQPNLSMSNFWGWNNRRWVSNVDLLSPSSAYGSLEDLQYYGSRSRSTEYLFLTPFSKWYSSSRSESGFSGSGFFLSPRTSRSIGGSDYGDYRSYSRPSSLFGDYRSVSRTSSVFGDNMEMSLPVKYERYDEDFNLVHTPTTPRSGTGSDYGRHSGPGSVFSGNEIGSSPGALESSMKSHDWVSKTDFERHAAFGVDDESVFSHGSVDSLIDADDFVNVHDNSLDVVYEDDDDDDRSLTGEVFDDDELDDAESLTSSSTTSVVCTTEVVIVKDLVDSSGKLVAEGDSVCIDSNTVDKQLSVENSSLVLSDNLKINITDMENGDKMETFEIIYPNVELNKSKITGLEVGENSRIYVDNETGAKSVDADKNTKDVLQEKSQFVILSDENILPAVVIEIGESLEVTERISPAMTSQTHDSINNLESIARKPVCLASVDITAEQDSSNSTHRKTMTDVEFKVAESHNNDTDETVPTRSIKDNYIQEGKQITSDSVPNHYSDQQQNNVNIENSFQLVDENIHDGLVVKSDSFDNLDKHGLVSSGDVLMRTDVENNLQLEIPKEIYSHTENNQSVYVDDQSISEKVEVFDNDKSNKIDVEQKFGFDRQLTTTFESIEDGNTTEINVAKLDPTCISQSTTTVSQIESQRMELEPRKQSELELRACLHADRYVDTGSIKPVELDQHSISAVEDLLTPAIMEKFTNNVNEYDTEVLKNEDVDEDNIPGIESTRVPNVVTYSMDNTVEKSVHSGDGFSVNQPLDNTEANSTSDLKTNIDEHVKSGVLTTDKNDEISSENEEKTLVVTTDVCTINSEHIPDDIVKLSETDGKYVIAPTPDQYALKTEHTPVVTYAGSCDVLFEEFANQISPADYRHGLQGSKQAENTLTGLDAINISSSSVSENNLTEKTECIEKSLNTELKPLLETETTGSDDTWQRNKPHLSEHRSVTEPENIPVVDSGLVNERRELSSTESTVSSVGSEVSDRKNENVLPSPKMTEEIALLVNERRELSSTESTVNSVGSVVSDRKSENVLLSPKMSEEIASGFDRLTKGLDESETYSSEHSGSKLTSSCESIDSGYDTLKKSWTRSPPGRDVSSDVKKRLFLDHTDEMLSVSESDDSFVDLEESSAVNEVDDKFYAISHRTGETERQEEFVKITAPKRLRVQMIQRTHRMTRTDVDIRTTRKHNNVVDAVKHTHLIKLETTTITAQGPVESPTIIIDQSQIGKEMTLSDWSKNSVSSLADQQHVSSVQTAVHILEDGTVKSAILDLSEKNIYVKPTGTPNIVETAFNNSGTEEIDKNTEFKVVGNDATINIMSVDTPDILDIMDGSERHLVIAPNYNNELVEKTSNRSLDNNLNNTFEHSHIESGKEIIDNSDTPQHDIMSHWQCDHDDKRPDTPERLASNVLSKMAEKGDVLPSVLSLQSTENYNEQPKLEYSDPPEICLTKNMETISSISVHSERLEEGNSQDSLIDQNNLLTPPINQRSQDSASQLDTSLDITQASHLEKMIKSPQLQTDSQQVNLRSLSCVSVNENNDKTSEVCHSEDRTHFLILDNSAEGLNKDTNICTTANTTVLSDSSIRDNGKPLLLTQAVDEEGHCSNTEHKALTNQVQKEFIIQPKTDGSRDFYSCEETGSVSEEKYHVLMTAEDKSCVRSENSSQSVELDNTAAAVVTVCTDKKGDVNKGYVSVENNVLDNVDTSEVSVQVGVPCVNVEATPTGTPNILDPVFNNSGTEEIEKHSDLKVVGNDAAVVTVRTDKKGDVNKGYVTVSAENNVLDNRDTSELSVKVDGRRSEQVGVPCVNLETTSELSVKVDDGRSEQVGVLCVNVEATSSTSHVSFTDIYDVNTGAKVSSTSSPTDLSCDKLVETSAEQNGNTETGVCQPTAVNIGTAALVETLTHEQRHQSQRHQSHDHAVSHAVSEQSDKENYHVCDNLGQSIHHPASELSESEVKKTDLIIGAEIPAPNAVDVVYALNAGSTDKETDNTTKYATTVVGQPFPPAGDGQEVDARHSSITERSSTHSGGVQGLEGDTINSGVMDYSSDQDRSSTMNRKREVEHYDNIGFNSVLEIIEEGLEIIEEDIQHIRNNDNVFIDSESFSEKTDQKSIYIQDPENRLDFLREQLLFNCDDNSNEYVPPSCTSEGYLIAADSTEDISVGNIRTVKVTGELSDASLDTSFSSDQVDNSSWCEDVTERLQNNSDQNDNPLFSEDYTKIKSHSSNIDQVDSNVLQDSVLTFTENENSKWITDSKLLEECKSTHKHSKVLECNSTHKHLHSCSNEELKRNLQSFEELLKGFDVNSENNVLSKLMFTVVFLKTAGGASYSDQMKNLYHILLLEDMERLQNHLCPVIYASLRLDSHRMQRYLLRGYSRDMATVWHTKRKRVLDSLLEQHEDSSSALDDSTLQGGFNSSFKEECRTPSRSHHSNPAQEFHRLSNRSGQYKVITSNFSPIPKLRGADVKCPSDLDSEDDSDSLIDYNRVSSADDDDSQLIEEFKKLELLEEDGLLLDDQFQRLRYYRSRFIKYNPYLQNNPMSSKDVSIPFRNNNSSDDDMDVN